MEGFLSRRHFLLSGATTLSGVATLGFGGLPLIKSNLTKADTVHIGLIGADKGGSGIAHVMKDLPWLSLVACCDILPELLQKGRNLSATGASGYTDYRKMLEDKTIDAIIVASPLHLHYPMAMDAIDAGKHVYLEKTMCYDIPRAIVLAEKVNNSPLVFQVGHQYRYFALYHKIYEIINDGWCGDVTHFECQYHRNSEWRRKVKDPKMEN